MHSDTQSQTHTQSHSHIHTRFDSSMYLKPSLSHTHTHTHTKIPRHPAPATRAVYQVIIVWLQRFIICTDWVTTDGKGQAPLTRCSRNIFPRRPRVCPPSPLKGLIANAFVWGRGEETTRSGFPQVPLRRNINAAQSVRAATHNHSHTYEKTYTWEQFGTISNHTYQVVPIKRRSNSFQKTILDNKGVIDSFQFYILIMSSYGHDLVSKMTVFTNMCWSPGGKNLSFRVSSVYAIFILSFCGNYASLNLVILNYSNKLIWEKWYWPNKTIQNQSWPSSFKSAWNFKSIHSTVAAKVSKNIQDLRSLQECQ